MAKATHAVRYSERVVVDSEEIVVLEISQKEARVLVEVFANIGGCPKESGRKHTEAVGNALGKIGIKPTYNMLKSCRGIYFEDGAGL